MIDGQMVQLTERIDAVIRLVRSLKEENASLKKTCNPLPRRFF